MGIITPRIDDNEIANFDIAIHRMVDVYTDSSAKGNRHVEISLIFENGDSSERKRVALSKLSAVS